MDFRSENPLQRLNLLHTVAPRPVVHARGCRNSQAGLDVQGTEGGVDRMVGRKVGRKESRKDVR